jgi:uncharacterized protein YcbK (DUF882 family)
MYKKKAGVQLSKSFNSNEFDCKCNQCTETLIDLELVKLLQDLRDRAGRPVQLNCGFRCPAHNKAVGGVSNSQHVLGIAADIEIVGLTPNQVADIADPMFNGMGRYSTFTHVDNRDLGQKGVKARWDFRDKE